MCFVFFRIKTKSHKGIQLPKLEQYTNSESTQIFEKGIQQYIFKWQEKIFSQHEIEKYSNVHNCVTDTELSYFEQLENTPCEGKKIFTYINEDYNFPLPFEIKKENKFHSLNSHFEKMKLGSIDKLGRVFNDGSISVTHLFRSSEDIYSETVQWMTMHIMCDNSEYNEDCQLSVKQEAILFSIYYNATENFVIFMPDTNNINFNPYTTNGGKATSVFYSVDIDYGGEEKGEELIKMLSKLHKKWENKHKYLMNFSTPPLGKKKIHISLEIVSANGFEMDNIYIEYHIKIPDVIASSDTNNPQGKTHTTSALKTNGLREWKYGHIIDLEMEYSTGLAPPPIKVYLEVISTDWWGRHRTEGYTFLPITLDPGLFSRNLLCMRPEELDTMEAESRRFFVGGCNLIKDLDVLDTKLQSAEYRFVSTGSLNVRWGVVRARGTSGAGSTSGADISTSGAGSGALRAADAALRRYRRARALLAAALE